MTKKIIAITFLTLIVLFSFPGCSSNSKTLDLDVFCDAVLNEIQYDDELAILPERIASDYYDLSFDGLEDFRIYVSGTAATSNELAIMKLADSNAVKMAEDAIKTRINDQTNTYGNYRPDEVFRLESALIVKKDLYILFSVSNHNEEIEKIFNDSFK